MSHLNFDFCRQTNSNTDSGLKARVHLRAYNWTVRQLDIQLFYYSNVVRANSWTSQLGQYFYSRVSELLAPIIMTPYSSATLTQKFKLFLPDPRYQTPSPLPWFILLSLVPLYSSDCGAPRPLPLGSDYHYCDYPYRGQPRRLYYVGTPVFRDDGLPDCSKYCSQRYRKIQDMDNYGLTVNVKECQ